MWVLPKPDKHPAIFAAYTRLPVGESSVVVNNHDPKHLREDSMPISRAVMAGSTWRKGPRVRRIRISKRFSTACLGSGATPWLIRSSHS